MSRCVYCQADFDRDVADEPRCPPADDDASWGEIALEHNRACEWIDTRAHQRAGGSVNRPWTYDEYWQAVLGASTRELVRDFDLVGPRASLDEWLGLAEAETWREVGSRTSIPAEWREFHAQALDALCDAVERLS